MYLAYFDEVKPTETSALLILGGILVPVDSQLGQLENDLRSIAADAFGHAALEKETEWHGIELWQGKGVFRRWPLAKRLDIFRSLADCIGKYNIAFRAVAFDVEAHNAKYRYPDPPYKLGLMLLLEKFCEFLGEDRAVVFGDYEKDEMAAAVRDFSNYQFRGVTDYYGRSLESLIDTIYFTHSHHSRLLQLADVMLYMVQRFEFGSPDMGKWHEQEGHKIWSDMKTKAHSYVIKTWP